MRGGFRLARAQVSPVQGLGPEASEPPCPLGPWKAGPWRWLRSARAVKVPASPERRLCVLAGEPWSTCWRCGDGTGWLRVKGQRENG